MAPAVKFPKLPTVDLVKVLEESGVLAAFAAAIQNLLDRGHVPSDDQSRKLFAEAMAAAPGAIRSAIDALPLQLAEALMKGQSKITKDPSSLA